MSKTLIVGDVHLGKSLNLLGKPGIGSAYNSRVVDQKKLLDWIYDVAHEKQVDRLILTGDIFEDVKPDYSLVQIFIDWLKSFEFDNIDIHVIAGNHDLKRTGSAYTSILDVVSSCDFDHVYVYKHITTIHTPGAGFTLVPYRDRRGLNCETNADGLKIIEDSLAYEALSIEPFNSKVLIGHLTLEDAIYVGDEIDDLLNELICPLTMFSDYHYVWMGHVHRPQVRSRKPHIAHIGSLDLSDFGETDQTKILVLFDPTSESKFETIPVPSRPLRRLKINVPEDKDSNDYVISEINTHNSNYPYKNAVVRIDVTLNSVASLMNKKLIEEHLYKLGTFHINNISEARNISVVPIEKRDLVDNTMDEKAAIKLYSNLLDFHEEAEQNEFVSLCMEIVEEYQLSQSK